MASRRANAGKSEGPERHRGDAGHLLEAEAHGRLSVEQNTANSPSYGSSVRRKTQIEPRITKQTNQANFNGTKLGETWVPLPPLAEQKRIITKVDQLMGLCDDLEAKIRQAGTDGQQLMQAVVGSLVA